MFAQTSMDGKTDMTVYNGGGSYAFRLNGQNPRRIGSLYNSWRVTTNILLNFTYIYFAQLYTHTHTHICICVCVYIYICICICMHQKRACWAKPLFGLTIYLYRGSGYPTLGCSRLRDPMRSLSSLSQHFLLLRPSLSLSFLPPKLHLLSIHSFLLFIVPLLMGWSSLSS